MKSIKLILTITVFFLTACNGTLNFGIENTPSNTALQTQSSSTKTPLPTDTSLAGPATLVPTSSPLPPTTATLAPVHTTAPVATNSAVPNPTSSKYIDDRSTPSQVIVSLYSAINRQEYARAYNYWINPSSSVGNFAAYAEGFKNTAAVQLAFGQITSGAGAGQIYYSVPVILKTTATNGTHANFAACYLVHQAQPANFGEPPFNPMGIDQGAAKPSDINASDASALVTACTGIPTGANPVPVSGGNLNIDKNNFVDNRSGPVETISSLLNAINLKQFVRAYSYFQTPASFPGAYDTWAAGYSQTDTIKVTFGAPQTEGAAGSLYYKLPLAMKVLMSSNTTQTFVGCYTLHLSQPALQATPPFQPLGIIGGKFTQVANGTDVNPLLPAACN